jgi:putative tryptophan/tyrosine transport system substrate-binding protein
VAVLVNPTSPDFGSTIRNVEAAARTIGLQIQVLNASSSREINEAFATFVQERPDALLTGTGPPFTGRRAQLVQLAAFHRIPAIYAGRQNAEIGGLMSYGASLTDTYRQLGVYTSRILKGAKPADLPVVQSSKFELVINAETARMLGVTIPPSLIARADEVIE